MSTPISLKHLEIFVRIVEGGGLSEAATKLNISPSAISKNLAALEGMLGTTLIKRTTRSITLTDAGQYLFSRASKLLHEFDNTLNITAGYYNNPQGELRVTCSVAFGYSRLVHLINKYRQRFPDINLYINLNDNLINLNETNFDLALRISRDAPQNYAMRKLAPIRWVYCATAAYLKKKGIPTKRTELISHDCLIYPGLTPTIKVMDEHIHQLKNEPIQANSSLVLLKFVLENQGIAYLPSYLISDHVQKGELTPLLLDGNISCDTHSLYALYFPCKYSNPKVRSFIDFLVSEMQPIPVWDIWISS